LEGSFDDSLKRAKILGHANIKMTERYAELGQPYIARTGTTAKAIWALLDGSKLQPEKRLALMA
jgi:hypothetical protein